MRAYVLHGIGDLRYEERPLPELKPGWALLRVLAAGICSSDIPRIYENGTYHFPTVPGHEFCGRVEAVASGSDAAWVGKRAGVFPLIPCKRCPSCRRGQYETCERYDYLGSRRDGGFAGYVAVPVWNLIELPETASDLQGALLEPAAVALHAVKRAGIVSGGRVCIVGTGPIALLAGQWARLYGAERVFIKGRRETKRAAAEACGMEFLACSTIGETFPYVIEAVGTLEALAESLALSAPGGTVVLLGNPSGPRTLSQDQYWSVLRKQLTLAGSWNSSYGGAESDWEMSVQAMARGKLVTEPIVSHVLPVNGLQSGLAVMREKKEAYCKIIVQWC